MANLPSNPLPRSPSFQNLSFLADEAVLDILDAQPGPDWSINDYNGGFIYEGIDPNAPGAFPEPVQEEDDLFRGNAFPGHVLHLAASVNPATRFHVLLSAIQAQIKVNYPASIPHFEQCARAFATAQDRGRPGPVSDMTVYVFLIRTATELFDWLVENKELELVKFGWGVYMLGCGFKNPSDNFRNLFHRLEAALKSDPPRRKHIHTCSHLLLQEIREGWRCLRWWFLVCTVKCWAKEVGVEKGVEWDVVGSVVPLTMEERRL